METKETSRVVSQCQVCRHAPLESVLFLGYLPPVNDFRPLGEKPKEEPSYPAEIVRCTNCHLVQSGLIVDPTIIFPPSYPYTSSTTRVLRDNFAELYRECAALFPLKSSDLVVDIGSNDGNLLSNFKDHHKVLGITPEDIGKLAIERGIPTILDYFTPAVAEQVLREHGKAKVITAANVFAHMDDINGVVESILKILDDDGIFITENHYLLPLVEMNQFDVIYHEHLRYYSLHSLQYLLEKHGLEVIHAKQIPTHAGSIRTYAARKGKYPPKDTVAPLLQREADSILKKERLDEFRKRVVLAKLEIIALLRDIKKAGGRIYGIGAPSRGTTMVHYLGLNHDIIDCTLEIKGSHKIDKYVPGTLIPVLEESKLYTDQPEYVFLFSWNIAEELMPKMKEKGFKGSFIVPLPNPRVVKV